MSVPLASASIVKAAADAGAAFVGFGWKTIHEQVAPDLPAALFDQVQARQLDAFASQLSGFWHWGMYEIRLSAHDSQVDVLGSMKQCIKTRICLRECLDVADDRNLSSAARTLRAWTRDDGGPVTEVPNVWLEWDRDGSSRSPLFWLCLAPNFLDRNQAAPSPAKIGHLVEELMRHDPDLAVDGAAKEIVRLAECLPPGGQLMNFASLRPRGRRVCRVFASLPPGTMAHWLDAIGWDGDRRHFEHIHPMFRVEGEQEWCQIEFGDAVHGYLALELAQTQRGFPRRDARTRWLNSAIAHGWASREKCDAVLQWHGMRARQSVSGQTVNVYRNFHLKLALGVGEDPVAKAYLGFYCRRVREK